MHTEHLIVDPAAPEPGLIERGAAVLRSGGLVAFPTETVYGLGANALDSRAVARIFEAKGRPATNPIIVHVAGAEAARSVVADWPEIAARLAEAFWPGPLTLVLPRQPEVPDIVTAGGPTVAVRVPAHPVALALVRAAGVPVAAPSANPSSRLSPTRAEHVLRGLSGRIEMLLDGGATPGGIESTVLDLTCSPPRLLRPGLLAAADIESVIGEVAGAPAASGAGPLRSPGLLTRHYAPRARLLIVEGDASPSAAQLAGEGKRVAVLALRTACEGDWTVVQMPASPVEYGAALYATLHDLDEARYDAVVVEAPPDAPEWVAILDRLRRGAAEG